MHPSRRNEHPPLDADTARQLLEGLSPDDAPPGYADVARVLRAGAAPVQAEELADEADYIAHAAAAFDDAFAAMEQRRRRPAKRVIAALATGFVLTTGMAAAGALPVPAQRLAAAVLDNVGISVPAPPNAHEPEPDTESDDRTGTPEAAPADEHEDESSTSKGSDISNLTTTTDATGVDKGAAVSQEASNGQSQAGTEHPANAHAPQEPPTPPGPPAPPEAEPGPPQGDPSSGKSRHQP